MAKFRKIPVLIEAVQWTGENLFEIIKFIEGKAPDLSHPIASDKWEDYEAIVKRDGLEWRKLGSDQKKQKADIGDFIIKDIKGMCYPCKPDVFKETYEPVD